MLNWSNNVKLTKTNILDVFWNEIVGRKKVMLGNVEYIIPLNYKTDEKEVIVEESLPIINLKNNNLPMFEEAITEYIQTFFESERHWANPIFSCNSQKEKLIYAFLSLWLNATPADYDNPVAFVRRYTNFLKDNTFDEFWDRKKIEKMQTLRNCGLSIRQIEQGEFQETPVAITFTINVENQEKQLPRIAYGISDKVAYIYGIQGYKDKKTPEMKKVNRERFQVNNMENIPEDYHNLYLKQEPYAYISLFAFLCMLKQKGINQVVMPAYLPQRYVGKELGMDIKQQEILVQLEKERKNKESTREEKIELKDIEKARSDHQRVQYNVTNKFLDYMARMECDVPGLTITQTPDINNGSMVIDISQMNVEPNSNLIFYEMFKKIEALMKTKSISGDGR